MGNFGPIEVAVLFAVFVAAVALIAWLIKKF